MIVYYYRRNRNKEIYENFRPRTAVTPKEKLWFRWRGGGT